jgi:serine/threonine-protein kinase HipA
MKNKCLYCYQLIEEDIEFHSKCSKEFFGTTVPPKISYSFDQMDVLAKNVVERSVAVPGVQPKLSMTLVKKTKENTDDRLTVVGALGGNYIFKPPSERFYQMPENEHLTMRIAEAFGIKVVQSSLIRLQSGELSYITKRIDRKENADKIHMIDMFQITEAYDKYKSSYEKIGKALSNYSSNPLLDKSFFFDLILFSFITGNNDMHLKNFSMIETELGWILSPAYDLLNVAIILPEDTEELALTLAGKKKKFRKAHFEQFGKELGLNSKQIKNAFQRMIKNKPKALKWIEASFLSDELKEGYKLVLESNYQKFIDKE